MPIDRAGTNVSLLEMMRAMALGKAKRGESPAATGGVSDAGRGADPAIAAATPQRLKVRLKQLLQDVDPDDYEALTRVRTSVLREVILSEFGEEFRGSADFHPMIESISEAMDANQEFMKQFVVMARGLRR